MRLFRKYFKLPLIQDEISCRMIWTEDYDRAFDFEKNVSKADCLKIVAKLNDKYDKKIQGDLSYDGEGKVLLDGDGLLFIRSWGRLTGTGGGLGLSPEKACEIQDDFAHWIIEKLKE